MGTGDNPIPVMRADASTPLDMNIEPGREILRRIYMGFGRIALRHSVDDKLIAAAQKFATEGWLKETCRYPCGGLTYLEFTAQPKLDVRALKDL